MKTIFTVGTVVLFMLCVCSSGFAQVQKLNVPDQVKVPATPDQVIKPDQVKVPTNVPDQVIPTKTYATPDQTITPTTTKTYSPDQTKAYSSGQSIEDLLEQLGRLERQPCQPIRNIARRCIRNKIAAKLAELLPPSPPLPF